MIELYERFKDNICIHWGTLSDNVRNEILKSGCILNKNGKSYLFGKEIVGMHLK